MGVLKFDEERRASRRRPLEDVPQIVEVKVDSQAVKVIDISSGGVCIESPERMMLGHAVRLHIVAKKSTIQIRCRVVRCVVKSVAAGQVVYQAAAKFEKPLPLVDEPSSAGAAATNATEADVPEIPETDNAPTLPAAAIAAVIETIDPEFIDNAW
jgi:PilZ domain-containing protein